MNKMESFEGGIAIGCLIMHDEFSLDEVVAVWDGLEGVVDHVLNQLRSEIGEFVDGFQVCSAVGDAKRDLKLIFFDELFLKEVFFYN